MRVAIYQSGSSCILPKSHDIDLIYYYDNNDERMSDFRTNHNKEYDIHFDMVDRAKRVRLGCYIYPFMKHIEGEDLHFEDFSIFDVKDEYIELLKKHISFLPKQDKKWYHIYIAVRMFDKGKMTLTKKEKEIAQKIHDEGINEEIYQYIIDYLK